MSTIKALTGRVFEPFPWPSSEVSIVDVDNLTWPQQAVNL
jgi:hypothetical protein